MFTTAYYIRKILAEIISRDGESSERRLVVRADNAIQADIQHN
jgi:hypothetical protein